MQNSSFSKRVGIGAFTLIELLTVVAVILILAGLLIAALPYIQGKPARERARAEIAAMEAALENYRHEQGSYPENLSGANGARVLYQALTGDGSDMLVSSGGVPSNGQFGRQGKIHMDLNLKKNVNQTTWEVTDPWGAPYQYFTGPTRNNPSTFDLYSAAGKGSDPANSIQWVKNW